MRKVKQGTHVSPLGINRFVCADGVKSRAILIDPDPQMKYIAFSDKVKRRVEVDQEAVIKYGFRPYTSFFYLVAHLNTDMKGNVVSDDFVVEYLQLSENLNNELSDLIVEFGDFNSLVMVKVPRKGPNGEDFSHIKTTPSNYPISEGLQAKINELRSNQAMIDTMWKLVDRATSITLVEYEQLLAQQAENNQGATRPALNPNRNYQSTPSISAPTYSAPTYSAPTYSAPEIGAPSPKPTPAAPIQNSQYNDNSSQFGDMPFSSDGNDFGFDSDDTFA